MDEVAAATLPLVARRRRGTVDGGWGEEGGDINYVRLAKAGGRKGECKLTPCATQSLVSSRPDLLQHHEYSRVEGAEPVVYPRVDWFDHRPPSPVPPAQLPAINTHDTSLLYWPVEEVERKRRHRKTRLPALWQKAPLQPSPNRQRSRTKLPPLYVIHFFQSVHHR